jgi:acetylornithine deacetylase
VNREQPSVLTKEHLTEAAMDLLKNLIATPSFSKEEDATAVIIEKFFKSFEIQTHSYLNNIWVLNYHFDENKPTILLNSHHDTVKPNKAYSLDPFSPIENDGKLYGLGSNDAGGSLVSLAAAFLYFYNKELNYNLVFAASAEEEISGKNGIESLLPLLPSIDSGIVGEPTLMQLAVAERGLMVLDAVAKGIAGHAARNEGENAIYKAIRDIEWISNYQFDRISDLLGPVRMNVTSIETENKAHNVVPPECSYIIDVRINELYQHEEVLEIIRSHIQSELNPRSCRLRSTSIAMDHPLVKAGLKLGRKPYGSPTSSDKALMSFPTLKMGPGDSARSHTADEFIYLDEIREGIGLYIELLEEVLG